ncbi:uncharacterized protein LOC142640032 [Castanea sativa]|uniref:uncharacterized protein LOC142640032 n=1 Tax=Castanea sativa TaxID=21020 RepID=UPI003F6532FE
MLVKSAKVSEHLRDLQETFDTLRMYKMKLNPNKCVFGVTAGKFLGFMVSQRGIEVHPEKVKAIMELSPPRTVKEVQSLTRKIAALNRFVSRATGRCLPFLRTLRRSFEWMDECQRVFEELKAYLSAPPLLSPSAPGEELFLYLVVSSAAGADEMPTWKVHIDESSNKNTGGVGVVLYTSEGDKIECMIRLDFATTNNEAEYEALVAGLELAIAAGARKAVVYSDSKVVASQVNGSYDYDIRMQEVSTENGWKIPILAYLKDGKLPDNKDDARKLKVKAAQFVLVKNVLTTARTPTGETPFRLVYGTEALIPAEVGLVTYRVESYEESKNNEASHLELDLVDEIRAVVAQRLARYQDMMAKHYNSKVKHKDFQVGDLVLRKVLGATNDASQGKLGPNWEGPYRIISWHRKRTYYLETLDGRKLSHPWNTEHLKKYYQ